MINKFFKTIHNKYTKFFKFIFFLKHLFIVFFISITSFLLIPIFFDYDKRTNSINKYLINNYNLNIKKHKRIKYKAFPLPHLKFEDNLIGIEESPIDLEVKDLKIFPKIFSIYNYDNFQIDKIILKNSEVKLSPENTKYFIVQIFNKRKKFFLDNLNIKFTEKNKIIIEVENILYSNYGYNKDIIKGKIFDKKFKTNVKNNSNNINFKLLNSGINIDINFDENQKETITSGTFKSRILNTNLKFNFFNDDKIIKIYNSYFRSKNLSFQNEIFITLNPFLDINSKINIDEINSQIFKVINFNKIIKSKHFIKKINSKNEINFKPKKVHKYLVDEASLDIELIYGRLIYTKKFSISESLFECFGDVNFLEDYPILSFNCSVLSKNKQKLFKKFSIKSKSEDKSLQINVVGNLNILNKKINFKEILTNGNNKVVREDLIFFKKNFESIILTDNFYESFNKRKIEKFITEVL